MAGSPADHAGLQVGDVITSVGGANVASSDDLGTAVRSHRAGDTVVITWLRGGSRHTARVQLASQSG